MSEAWKRWEGQIIGGVFPLMRYLGGSDHSAVFQTVRSSAAAQKFAIKLIPADPQNAEHQLRRWQQSAKLADPNLIRTFESGRGELEGTQLLFVVLEFAEEDLSQILPERALAPDEVREMLPPVLKALAYIHGQGFVHGRIKPSNIMAVADQVKLAGDTLRAAAASTGESSLRELTIYDPPEAASGKPSPASDVWSLGVTLVEILTQRQPAWDRSSSAEPALPEGIPAPFRDIVQRSLQVDPQQRWTAGEIAARLYPQQPATKTVAVAAPARRDEKNPALWRYVIGVAVVALLAWALIPKTKNQDLASPAPVAQVESQPTPAPVASAAKGSSSTPKEAKPSPSKNNQSPEVQTVSKKTNTAVAAKGAVVKQVLPTVSPSARATIEGKIRVRVRVDVDPSGNVTEAKIVTFGPSRYFARIAMEAARDWKFTPPQVDGRALASQWILRFGFRRSDTDVVVTQTAP